MASTWACVDGSRRGQCKDRFLFLLSTSHTRSTDSLMREIALKKGNVTGNLLRYDKEFASSFIHFLCLNLTFDDYWVASEVV